MSSILFRGAVIRYADLRPETEGDIFCRLHLQTDLSQPVSDSMKWKEIPDCCSTAKLTGKLTGRNLVLTPTDKELRNHEIQMECTDVSDFAAVPEKDDEGNVTGHRLNFIARSVEVGAIAKVEQYRRVVGSAMAALAITYEEQSKLDFAGEATSSNDASDEDKKQEVLEGVEDGLPINSPQIDAPLPSVTQMAGTTAELRRQRRARKEPIPIDPGAAEWRTQEEIAEGTPHHVNTEVM